MKEKKIYTLKIDTQFKNLIRPLHQKEYDQLVKNLIADGCNDPLITWQGYIIDGHNRYSICHEYKIPFTYIEKEFDCREEAVAWICANQLGRRNISEETRKYLIGKQYESEKIANTLRNARGKNQYYYDEEQEKESESSGYAPLSHKTAEKIGNENHISHGTVQKYSIYARAIENLAEKDPRLASKILSGRYKISHQNILELAKMSKKELEVFGKKIERSEKPYIQYNTTRKALESSSAVDIVFQGPSVNDMPVYDPDAEVTGLTLTVPSWTSSIIRTMDKTNLTEVSDKAKANLISALSKLNGEIEKFIKEIEGL